MDLGTFQEKVRAYCHAADYNLQSLARDIDMDFSVFSNKLRGNRKNAPFTNRDFKAIVKSLARQQAILTESQANELLELVDLRASLFTPEEWKLLGLEPTRAELQVAANPLKAALQPPPDFATRLALPEGTMDWRSPFYVERLADKLALATLQRSGVTITIKGPRQVGKSSLLLRLSDAAAVGGKQIAFLDFQLFDKAALNDATTFYRQFCGWLSAELNISDKVAEYWQASLSNSVCCTRYMQLYLLPQLKNPLVLAMDEVESLFDTSFRSDFFGMLRSWHNSRSQLRSPWKQVDLVLVTSTEPYQLIDDLNHSPFNVGQLAELQDFSREQVADLNRRHASPLNTRTEQQLWELVGGHPYLVRKALYMVASQLITVSELFATAKSENGLYGDHLRYYLFRLKSKAELVRGFKQILATQSCEDETVFFRLRGAGLVTREGQRVLPRCQLYAAYFKERLGD